MGHLMKYAKILSMKTAILET